ncbi:MAG: DUF4625 domain-containing protein [Cytophagales bacterium]|uniref:DUF4625 domain-containing protein n=1 Tax=Cyclobacterium marinum TaxID=104 RepID=UPI0011EF8B24|nr:DUF4625 domain-containing protein [Cyclobacterium marinum]MBI0399315.1 DUF4625 domain-containing protein [Cyclobacterium marinum]MBR9775381.1 DUF4625 domain-containing protein [Cytophagales bacterium]|tara:strand:+ start:3410 stop:3856 length:447 start_codon:yes stop_codon:yes gene_type:complete
MKSINKPILFVLSFMFILSSCQEDAEPNLPSPTIDNLEIGLNNDEIGVIGEDFHLNADILAGELIEQVQIQINPIDEESYDAYWAFELTWEEYKGVRNTNVHKHFDIPEDAVEGVYDFLIIVTDQNGTITEEKRSITIYKEENLPTAP